MDTSTLLILALIFSIIADIFLFKQKIIPRLKRKNKTPEKVAHH